MRRRRGGRRAAGVTRSGRQRDVRSRLIGRRRLADVRRTLDQPGTAAARIEAHGPADEHDQPVLESAQVPQMDEQPHEPRERPAQLRDTEIGNRGPPSDRRQVPLAVVPERPRPANIFSASRFLRPRCSICCSTGATPLRSADAWARGLPFPFRSCWWRSRADLRPSATPNWRP